MAAMLARPPISATKRPLGLRARWMALRAVGWMASGIQWRAALEKAASNSALVG